MTRDLSNTACIYRSKNLSISENFQVPRDPFQRPQSPDEGAGEKCGDDEGVITCQPSHSCYILSSSRGTFMQRFRAENRGGKPWSSICGPLGDIGLPSSQEVPMHYGLKRGN